MIDALVVLTVVSGLAVMTWLAAGVLSSPPPDAKRRPGVDYIARHGRPVDPTQRLLGELRAAERVQVGRALSGALICDPAAPGRHLPVRAQSLSAYERLAAATVTAMVMTGYLRMLTAGLRAGGVHRYVARTRLAALQRGFIRDLPARHRREPAGGLS